MTRGVPKDEAVSMITRGFLNIDIPGLPDVLREADRQGHRGDEQRGDVGSSIRLGRCFGVPESPGRSCGLRREDRRD